MLNDATSPLSLLLTRRSYKPAMLAAPAPDGAALDAILTAAIRVPDHGKLAPWRILTIDAAARPAFRDLAERAVRSGEDGAPRETAEARAAARGFGADAPLLLVVIERPVGHPKVPLPEQTLSAGALCQNLLLATHAQGFGGCWLTGWLSRSATVRAGLRIAPDERIAGILCIGTPVAVPDERPRPAVADVVARWPGA